jgi:hypothetical protein
VPLPYVIAPCQFVTRHAVLCHAVLCHAVLQAEPVIVYVRPEDEFFHKHATASFTFPVEGRAVGKDELQPLRLLMLLPANKVAAAR